MQKLLIEIEMPLDDKMNKEKNIWNMDDMIIFDNLKGLTIHYIPVEEFKAPTLEQFHDFIRWIIPLLPPGVGCFVVLPRVRFADSQGSSFPSNECVLKMRHGGGDS